MRRRFRPPGERPIPDFAHGDKKQRRSGQHGGGDGNAVGRREIVRFAERQCEATGDNHKGPVDRSHINLPVTLSGGLGDFQARQPAKLNGLARHRERAGNDRLAGDDRGNGREHNKRNEQSRRAEPVENIVGRWRALQDQGGLARVIQDETRKDQS